MARSPVRSDGDGLPPRRSAQSPRHWVGAAAALLVLAVGHGRAAAVTPVPSPPHLDLAWRTEPVDSTAGYYGHVSLDLDAASRAHVAYYEYPRSDDEPDTWVRYARERAVSGWDLSPGSWAGCHDFPLSEASIAVNSEDSPCIAYWYFDTEACAQSKIGGDLAYAWLDGSSWVSETIATGAWLEPVGPYPSMAIDGLGIRHIAFASYVGGEDHESLEYASGTSGAWGVQTLDVGNNAGTYASLTLDEDDQPVVAYYNHYSRTLKLATYDGQHWQTEEITQTHLSDVSLAVSSDGIPHLAFAYSPDPFLAQYAVAYATKSDGVWSYTDVYTREARGLSLAVHSDGSKHISFSDFHNETLVYASSDGDSWESEVLDGDVHGFTAMGIDGRFRLHIVYTIESFDPHSMTLMHAVSTPLPHFSVYLPLVNRSS